MKPAQTRPTFYPAWLTLLTLLSAAVWTFQSGWRWAHFSYATFDLAFYVQALDGFSHGRNWSSLLGMQPFGNHADFIIFLLWPIYAIFHHPLTLVVVQSLALAACLPLGWKIARERGWQPEPAFGLAAVLLINPVLTFVAIHEFHPEAFAAPLWLFIYYAWLKKNLPLFWLALVLFLSCKENLGLIAGVWCFTKLFERPNRQVLWQWILLPGIFISVWMSLYLFWLGPKWNAGNVDYGALYFHLQEKGFVRGAADVLSSSVKGNLLWALLLPMLLLPLRRPLCLLPALPILLQHLLSWRWSEWTIYYHYAAPLLPIFWIATIESLSPDSVKWRRWLPAMPFLLIPANIVCFFVVGTPEKFIEPFFAETEQLAEKRRIVREIPSDASVLAPFPFQPHLAERKEIYSLHLVLKGLKTLSRQLYTPPAATDYVIVDYDDSTTFDSPSGFYHPAMLLKSGTVVASSDVLLHRFLAAESWKIQSIGSLTVWQKTTALADSTNLPATILRPEVVDAGTDLISIVAENVDRKIAITSRWQYRATRKKIPWMRVLATHRTTREQRIFTRGLACPEGRNDGKIWVDRWIAPEDFSGNTSEWEIRALFEDYASRSYTGRPPTSDSIITVDILNGQ